MYRTFVKSLRKCENGCLLNGLEKVERGNAKKMEWLEILAEVDVWNHNWMNW